MFKKVIFCATLMLTALIFAQEAPAQENGVWERHHDHYTAMLPGRRATVRVPIPDPSRIYKVPPVPAYVEQGSYWAVTNPDGSVTVGRKDQSKICSITPPTQVAKPSEKPVASVVKPAAPIKPEVPVAATPVMKPAPAPMAKSAVPAPVEKSAAQLAKVPPGTEVSCMVMPPLQEDRTINGVLYRKGQMLYLVGRKTPNDGYINKFGEPTNMPDIETSPPPGVKTFPYEPPNI